MNALLVLVGLVMLRFSHVQGFSTSLKSLKYTFMNKRSNKILYYYKCFNLNFQSKFSAHNAAIFTPCIDLYHSFCIVRLILSDCFYLVFTRCGKRHIAQMKNTNKILLLVIIYLI